MQSKFDIFWEYLNQNSPYLLITDMMPYFKHALHSTYLPISNTSIPNKFDIFWNLMQNTPFLFEDQMKPYIIKAIIMSDFDRL